MSPFLATKTDVKLVEIISVNYRRLFVGKFHLLFLSFVGNHHRITLRLQNLDFRKHPVQPAFHTKDRGRV